MSDKLIVKGLPPLDGTYEFDLMELMTIGSPGQLTNREGHRLKTMSGVRVGELEDALAAGDNDVLVALAAIILTRAGKRVDEEQLWDAPMGAAVSFEIEVAGGDAGPPASPPPTVSGESGQTVTPQTNGGGSSGASSESLGDVLKATGALV